MMPARVSEEPVIVISRILDAPRELAFQMFTDPRHLARFWGSPGCTSPVCEMDVRPGGIWRHVLRTPDGTEYPSTSVYLEVVRPEKIVYRWAPDKSPVFGNTLPPGQVNTIVFEEHEGKTRVTLEARLDTIAARDALVKSGFSKGVEMSLDRLMAQMKDAARELVITRVFDAPRELVFEAWTDPKHIASWWGPRGFTTTVHSMDVAPGGVWRLTMHGPDGRDYKNKIVYLEVAKPERLVYKNTPEHGSEPADHETTVTFEEQDAKTTVTLRMLFASAETRNHVVTTYKAVEGGSQTLSRLAEYLAAKRSVYDVVITRIVDAPREMVFRAWTDADHVKHWWGPTGFTNPRCELDPRPGGAIRIDMRAPDGTVFPMAGTYIEVVEPERLVFSSAALDKDGKPMFENLNEVSFEEYGDQTKVTVRAKVAKATPEAAPYLKGMDEGWNLTLDRMVSYSNSR
jgi:uncharacterized protein YndB with AHSA1/START domain